MKIIQPDSSYTFRSYFELSNDTDEILADFDYHLIKKRLQLPKTNRQLSGIVELKQNLEDVLPYVPLTSETARREILVAPVLSRVAIICQQILRIEYPVKVNNLLQGNLDYLIRSIHSLIVVEAKRDDLTRGFTQLAVELIALSMLDESPDIIYGTVTIGNVWIFGILDINSRTIFQDIGTYTLPDNLENLISILVGILE
ncbi:hypothetical protein VB711_07850 [Cronbergia sp. UHCC 0137]|uniref:hypothetical protein n=1 Tax=Cronbergia sp. UHCC 0137 TaxID=3110239 RepID=UPI002B1EC9B6|nr:hypothetical protein [Cronbergia sp. UHCC 0137]MEA5617750.1 hypothetical protein [Cronbergia sp. UHCC 0137]